ncbi:biotin synthase BioB [Polymorphobacter fuscus]|uniref:Biotin synthase n=1 Tax=Sandarakinorhabdus fusca TaxID=1439888 RepID=A0A7C9KWD1_9SPHN|nr:biotin synthase BioB [Polymorphobacter fuscus]KAB7648353.1 biotin synthase BioB [Polymorphobacter fuscus]MQT15866.1 biotin synthase BioB [Polymorphobacter fuscus]NJC07861.1 biotin synthase [Polymorphobacter fuscus]
MAISARARWSRADIAALFDLPFIDLVFRAQTVHRAHFDPNRVQKSQLLSIKTGGCPENCGYCAQSVAFQTGVKAEKLMAVADVVAEAARAKAGGATRFCMGAAWKNPRDRDMPALAEMVAGVRALGLETCMTLGMLSDSQTAALADAGLDYYNHNIDTAPEYYGDIVTTRSQGDRLDTVARVRDAGIGVCCGGIIGMGESRADRIGLIETLANLPEPPGSVPINGLVPIAGTPLGDAILSGAAPAVDGIEFVRTVAAARITMPRSMVRLSAGREAMSDETQALCFLAGANSIFVGDRLLTTANPGVDRDTRLFDKLGLTPMEAFA